MLVQNFSVPLQALIGDFILEGSASQRSFPTDLAGEQHALQQCPRCHSRAAISDRNSALQLASRNGLLHTCQTGEEKKPKAIERKGDHQSNVPMQKGEVAM